MFEYMNIKILYFLPICWLNVFFESELFEFFYSRIWKLKLVVLKLQILQYQRKLSHVQFGYVFNEIFLKSSQRFELVNVFL